MRRLVHTVHPARPSELGTHDGLAYSLWLPDDARAGIVVLHGAGSCKENHHDFARVALADGFAVIAFDQRGHGASDGPMDGRAIEDVAAIAALLRARVGAPALAVALRGSSMGGYLAIVAAPTSDASAVIAICPASSADLYAAVDSLPVPLLLLHAEGDEQVPVEHSRELAARTRNPDSRLITVPGGHHRSVQHDPELQAVSLRWLVGVLSGVSGRRRRSRR